MINILYIIIIIIVTWSESCIAAILSWPQLFTHNRIQLLISQSITIKKHFSLQKKVDFACLYQLLITRMYSYQCILRLLAFIRMLLVCSRILPVCIRMLPVCYPYVVHVFPSYWYSYVAVCIQVLLDVVRMLPVCCTRMYPHVSVCCSHITRMLPVCTSVVF